MPSGQQLVGARGLRNPPRPNLNRAPSRWCSASSCPRRTPAARVGPPGSARPGPADLDLGAIDAQGNALGCGVGEDAGQGMQPHVRTAGHGEAAGCQQRPDLMDGAGDGRAVHAVEHRDGGVREMEPQDDQGGDDPVSEHQVMCRASACGPLPAAATAITQPRLLLRHPRPGQLTDQLAQGTTRDTRADTMRQGRAGPC